MPAQRPSRRRLSSSTEKRPAPRLRNSTLVVMNMGKLIGFAIAVNETMIRDNLRESALAICALFVLGTQAAEDVALHFIDKLFSGAEDEDEE